MKNKILLVLVVLLLATTTNAFIPRTPIDNQAIDLNGTTYHITGIIVDTESYIILAETGENYQPAIIGAIVDNNQVVFTTEAHTTLMKKIECFVKKNCATVIEPPNLTELISVQDYNGLYYVDTNSYLTAEGFITKTPKDIDTKQKIINLMADINENTPLVKPDGSINPAILFSQEKSNIGSYVVDAIVHYNRVWLVELTKTVKDILLRLTGLEATMQTVVAQGQIAQQKIIELEQENQDLNTKMKNYKTAVYNCANASTYANYKTCIRNLGSG